MSALGLWEMTNTSRKQQSKERQSGVQVLFVNISI